MTLNPGLPKWVVLPALAYILFNLVIGVGLRDLLGRLLARKRIREVAFFLFVIAAALPQIAWGLTLSNEGLAEDLTARPIRIVHGHVEVSDRPGLGIEVDEERLRRYRRDVPILRVA